MPGSSDALIAKGLLGAASGEARPHNAYILAPFNKILGGGLAQGVIHEAVPSRPGDGAAAAGFLAGLARALLGTYAPIVWLYTNETAHEEAELYAPGLVAFGIDLKRLLLIRTHRRDDLLWAAEEALKQPGASVLLEIGTRGALLDLTATRRLTLAAQSSGATGFLLRHDLANRHRAIASAAWTRWLIAPAHSKSLENPSWNELGPPALHVELLRNRRGPNGACKVVKWNMQDGVFETQALDVDMASAPADGSSEAQSKRQVA